MYGILLRNNAYFTTLDMDIKDSIELIEGVIEQFYNDRLYINHSIENTIYSALGNEYKTFADYIKGLKYTNLSELDKLNIEIKNKKLENEAVKEQDNFLKEIL